jgi:hypothetical protein
MALNYYVCLIQGQALKFLHPTLGETFWFALSFEFLEDIEGNATYFRNDSCRSIDCRPNRLKLKMDQYRKLQSSSILILFLLGHISDGTKISAFRV